RTRPLGAWWISPFPDIKSPCQVALALRSAISVLQFCVDRHSGARLDQRRERTAFVGLLDDAAKRLLLDARYPRSYAHLRFDDEMPLARDLVHDDGHVYLDGLGRRACARELSGDGGGEAAGV